MATLNDVITPEQHKALIAYAKVRYDLLENLGNDSLNRTEIRQCRESLAQLGVTISQRDSIVGVRAHVGNASAMFEWNSWKQELHFFRERGIA